MTNSKKYLRIAFIIVFLTLLQQIFGALFYWPDFGAGKLRLGLLHITKEQDHMDPVYFLINFFTSLEIASLIFFLFSKLDVISPLKGLGFAIIFYIGFLLLSSLSETIWSNSSTSLWMLDYVLFEFCRFALLGLIIPFFIRKKTQS